MDGSYNYWLVSLSLVLAIVASFAALSIAARIPFVERRMLWLWMGGGSVSMGLAIWSMHFVGMLAFHIGVPLAYDVPLTILSIFYAVIATAFAITVVRLKFSNNLSLVVSSFFMGSGIAAMHYTGMDALKMSPEIIYDQNLFLLSLLIAYVASFVALRMFFTQAMNVEAAHQLFEPNRFLAAVIMGVAIAGMHYTAMEAAIFDPRSVCTAVGQGIDSGIMSILIVLAVLLIIALTILLLMLDTKYADNSRLQISEQRVRQVINSAPQGMIVVNADGLIEQVNRSVLKMFGYNREELMAKPIETLLPVNLREKHAQLRQTYLDDPQFRPMGSAMELAAFRKNGEEFRVEVGLSPMHIDNSISVLATIIDITERLKMENQLRRNQAELQRANRRIMLATDVTGIGIWEYDLKANVIIWDDMMYELYGVSQNENPCSYDAWESMIHADDVEYATNELKKVVQTQSEYDAEFRIVRPDGVMRWMKLHATHVTDQDGRVVQIIGTNQDVTERKEYANTLETIVKHRTNELEKAKKAAEDASEYKGLFLANMSHELRTPMHAIRSFTKLALKREADEKNLKYLRNIDTSADRLTALLNDLLDLSKLEAGKMTAEFQDCNILELFNEHLQLLESLAHDKKLDVTVHHQGQLTASVDKKLIGQVITNILSNAIKFSPERGKIKITINAPTGKMRLAGRDEISIQVSDQGPGIPLDEIHRIFDQFVQSSKTRTGHGNNGTGLGLPISREIIELHKGRIWASSPVADSELSSEDADKKGSTFHVIIPLQQK
jgi:PAS domain S-box-containing protein